MDAPFRLADRALQARLLAAMDVEDKIPRALVDLAPIAGGRVLLLDARRGDLRARQLAAAGVQLTVRSGLSPADLEPGSFDAIVTCWAGFDGSTDPAAPLRPLEPLLAPRGRLVCVEDYGRDDTTALWADEARERTLVGWSRRLGPLLQDDWRVRTLHCWWTFPDLATAAELLRRAFPATGAGVAAGLKRPRVGHKVAIFHRAPAVTGA